MTIIQRMIGLIVLNLIGAGVAVYQTYHFYAIRSATTGFRTFCQFGKFDCIAVEASPYAEFIFGLPLSGFVVGWLISISILLFLAMNEEVRRDLLRIVFGMTLWGVILGSVYLVIMINQIGSLCPFCLVIDLINILGILLLVSLKSQWWDGGPSDFSKWKSPAFITLGTLLFSLMVLHGAFSQSKKSSPAEVEYVATRFVNQPKLNVEIREGDLSIGPKDAKIVIVKYSDFQCSACEAGARVVHLLKYKYPNDIRFILRNYPLDSSCNSKLQGPMHPFACYFGQAIYCANAQGKLKEAYSYFFENQSKLSAQWLEKSLKHIPLDAEKFQACIDDPAILDLVKADVETGHTLEVEATPTFFVNGRKMSGSFPVEIWNSIIEKLLKNP